MGVSKLRSVLANGSDRQAAQAGIRVASPRNSVGPVGVVCFESAIYTSPPQPEISVRCAGVRTADGKLIGLDRCFVWADATFLQRPFAGQQMLCGPFDGTVKPILKDYGFRRTPGRFRPRPWLGLASIGNS